jgi:SM-20-related protein
MALRRCVFELLPADGDDEDEDDDVADIDTPPVPEVGAIFDELKGLSLRGVTWIGFRTEPLFFGLEKLIASCTLDEDQGELVLDAIQSLESVQSATLLSSEIYQGDPFDVCSRLFRSEASERRDGYAEAERQLRQRGVAIIDDFLPARAIAEVAATVRSSLASFPEFADDGISWRLPEPRTARSDVATWLAPGQRPATDEVFASEVMPALQQMEQAIGSFMKLQGRSEQQLAWYPISSSGYRRHTDALADGDPTSEQRKVTAILYLNDGWVAEHGGALRLWLPEAEGGAQKDVDPKGGRLLLFLSGCIKHEVLPCQKDRCALTSWIW